MPQLLILAALGALAYTGIRALGRVGEHLAAGLKQSDDTLRAGPRRAGGHKDGGTLEYDPASGVYKPKP